MTMTMILGALLLALTAGAEETAKPQVEPVEVRQHWAAVRADGRSMYDVTEIARTSDTVERSVIVVRDENGARWRFEHYSDYERHASMEEARDLKSGMFVRMSWKFRAKGKTIKEVLAWWKSVTDAERHGDVELTVESGGTRVAAQESEWNDRARSDDWRGQLRETFSVSFLDALERMRDTLMPHDVTFDVMKDLVAKVSYANACDSASEPYTKRVDLDPDCTFDKDMGYPCSDKQIQRIVKAAKDGRRITRY